MGRGAGAGSHCPREQHSTRLSPPPSSSINRIPSNPIAWLPCQAREAWGSCCLCLTKLIIEKDLEPGEAAFRWGCSLLGSVLEGWGT